MCHFVIENTVYHIKRLVKMARKSIVAIDGPPVRLRAGAEFCFSFSLLFLFFLQIPQARRLYITVDSLPRSAYGSGLLCNYTLVTLNTRTPGER